MPVWDRLCTDAAVRRTLPGRQGREWPAASNERSGVQQAAAVAAMAATAPNSGERYTHSGCAEAAQYIAPRAKGGHACAHPIPTHDHLACGQGQ